KSISNLDDQYDKNLQHLSQGTENRFIFASSAGEEVSREQDVKHHDDAVPHRHGTYTFHLLNALDGAAGGESGIIGLLDLQDYLDAQFKKVDAKQKPKCYIGEASRVRAIHLASAKDKA